LAASIVLLLSVERIVFGGGVMSDGSLLPLVRSALFELLHGYLPALADLQAANTYVCQPALGTSSGIAGALLLAQEELLAVITSNGDSR
jgi:fructokinase